MRVGYLHLLCFISVCKISAGPNEALPAFKTWWAKQVYPDFYAAGRLTNVQIKQAADVGFKSIVSNFNFTDNYTIGDDIIISSDDAKTFATEIAGLHYEAILPENLTAGFAWATTANVEQVAEALDRAPKPVLVQCVVSYSAVFMILSYHLKRGPNVTPKLDSQGFYDKAASLGFSYNVTELKTLIANFSGSPILANPPQPKTDFPDVWFSPNMWLFKPVAENYFMSGQIRSNYLPSLKEFGFKAVINLRQGLVKPPHNSPSQEEVTLLNVKDNTGTYYKGGRQMTARLEQTRINPNMSSKFISNTSEVNYQSRNPEEFGDNVGYNEELEKAAVEKEFTYYHTPIGGEIFFGVDMWKKYKDVWDKSPFTEPVLFHCRDGTVAGLAALLHISHRRNIKSDWAIRRAYELQLLVDSDQNTIAILKEVLDTSSAIRYHVRLDVVIMSAWFVGIANIF